MKRGLNYTLKMQLSCKYRSVVKKILFIGVCSTLLYANSTIDTEYGHKEYANSKTKDSGKYYKIGISNSNKYGDFSFNYTKDKVDRENFVTNQPLTSLKVKNIT
jgi:hypothetical protein